MPEPDGSDGGEAIRKRIEAARAELKPKVRSFGPAGDAHLAWRMVVDLVAGVGVGAAVGYGLDVLLGIQPVLLAVFTLLGFAAGVNLMLRTARDYQRKSSGGNPSGG
ncbi:MAG: AtpZ/AtpI family protein [Rhodobacteraceae bacterium]|nr:AtpZ/AtpI family protein [Paracoccaceae bacterium]